MSEVASIDFTTKRIFLHSDTVINGFDCIAAYFEINALIIANPIYQNHLPMLSAEGNIPKGGGNFTPRYALSDLGWRYVPYSLVAHTLSLLVEPVSLDGISGRDVFDRSTITVNIDIDEGYEKIEIREINTGGTTPALSPSESSLLSKIALLEKILRNKRVTDPVAGKQTIFDDDGVTELVKGDLWENTAETTPYQGNGINVADRLDDI